jgi:hypothetical protein
MPLIPHKACKIGMAIQSAKGTLATSPTVLFNINEDTSLDYNKNYTFFQYADGLYGGLTHYHSGGAWSEGTLRLPLVPGMLLHAGGVGGYSEPAVAANDISDVGTWAFARQALDATYYGQSLYATIFRDMGNKAERFGDCKVASGRLAVNFGELAMLDLNIIGAAKPVAWATPGAPSTATVERPPYRYSHASIALDGILAGNADQLTNNHAIEFDNMVVSPGDMGALWGQECPVYLPNAELTRFQVTFDRMFYDSGIYDKYLAETTSSYALFLTQSTGGKTYNVTILFPRTLYTAAPMTIPGSGMVNQGGIAFQALGTVSGGVMTPAFGIDETEA